MGSLRQLCDRRSQSAARASLQASVSIKEEKDWETNLTYQTDSSSRGREETVAKPACGCLAVDSAAVAEVGPGGGEAGAASCWGAAVAREADRNLCTCPCCADFGDPPAKRL